METVPYSPEIKQNPEAELAHLRERFQERKEQAPAGTPEHAVAREVVRSFAATAPETLFGANHKVNETVIAGIALELAPEAHDAKMGEIFHILQTKGIYAGLKVVEAMNDPHLEDDLHRFLSELVREGHGLKGLKEKSDLYSAVTRVLYAIELPRANAEQQLSAAGLRELISKMESLYAVMQGNEKDANTIAFEIGNAAGSSAFVFYAAVPAAWTLRFENQLHAVFPDAQLRREQDDYNIFAEGNAAAVSIASLRESPALPLKTFDTFDHDPMNLLVAAFGKLDHEREGALVQIIVSNASPSYESSIRHKKEAIEKGMEAKEVLKERTVLGIIGEMFAGGSKATKEEKEKKAAEAAARNKPVAERIERKLARPILPVRIRIAASAAAPARAEAIANDLESIFNQFSEPQGNALVFERVKPREIRKAVHAVAFRLPSLEKAMYLNTVELATLFHFESSGLSSRPELVRAALPQKGAPLATPSEGILLGENSSGTDSKKIYLADEDRMRHLYVIGQTGTGKSTLLKNIVIQDIEKGNGVCFIDPHGSDIEDILSRIPPERMKDVVYFDPSNLDYPMALNMLEYDVRFPEQKTFVVNELFSIFQKLYGAVPESMGPMFEQYFRNATLLTIEDPSSGSTLLHVSRVLSDKAYREMKLSRCNNPIVVSFWREIAAKAGGEASLANIVPYITSKFDVFLANDYMRPIISQEKSSLRFRDMLDNRSIFLVNLSKGRLGEINSNLLGLIIVGKILMAALSRVDTPDAERAPFNLIIDEFQNVTTDSIATIFSEARKYKLSLTVAHQYIAQLSENISKAVFGNVGTLASFRVGNDDAEYLEKQFAPAFKAADIANLPNGIAALKLLAHGRPLEPFNIHTYGFTKGNADTGMIKTESAMKYGTPREEVEKTIRESFARLNEPAPAAPPAPPAPKP